MIRVSTKGRYGVRFMLDLAAHHGGGPVTLKDIARRQEISTKYLWQVIPPLRDAGLVTAVRGPRGGYMLARKPGRISLKDVVTVLEGPVCLIGCVSAPSSCRRARGCAARDAWKDIIATLYSLMSTVTLENMLSRASDGAGAAAGVL